MTAPDLLPCPFCGGGIARTVGNASFSGVELMGAGTDRPYVWCGTCGSASSFEDSDHKAITAWNTRAPLAEALAMPEALYALSWAKAALAERGVDAPPVERALAALRPIAAIRAIGERAE